MAEASSTQETGRGPTPEATAQPITTSLTPMGLGASREEIATLKKPLVASAMAVSIVDPHFFSSLPKTVYGQEMRRIAESLKKPTLASALDKWTEMSSGELKNTTLQIIGYVAEKSPNYRSAVQSILKTRHPSGKIIVFRGGEYGKGLDNAVNPRVFTNVTSDRIVAQLYGLRVMPDGTIPEVKTITPALDGVVISIGDVVAIGSVGESELIVRVDKLTTAKLATAMEDIIVRKRTVEELLKLGDYDPPLGLIESRARTPSAQTEALEDINNVRKTDAIAKALKEYGDTVSLPANVGSLPVLSEGMVRLYRGEPAEEITPPTIKNLRGRWFSETIETAQRMADKSPKGIVRYIDIPKAEAETMLIADLPPEHPGGSLAKQYKSRHYILTPSWIAKTNPIAQITQNDIRHQGKK